MVVAVVVWFALVAAFFYLLVWRPQLRRMGAVRALQAQLREGDEIMTTSGMYGRIVALHDEMVEVEVAPGTVVRLARGAIGQRLGADADDAGPDA